MARILITGSADGLGRLAAKALAAQGHRVVLHARNAERSREAMKNVPQAEAVLTADLSDIAETKNLADEANRLGTFDAVIHNAGVYQAAASDILAVNVLAPYILTCRMAKPKRLVYLSSGMHLHGHWKMSDPKTGTGAVSYSDSKLYVLMLAMAAARKWPDVLSNAVDPGWVPTKMGGRGAPDDLQKGYETQVWLAVSDDEKAKVSGRYFFHQKESRHNPQADDSELQERLLRFCEERTGIKFPGGEW
ncbi:MAG TPA: SDR family NAD(P)-dependent oxidoreductase [Mucilaginibacter sp.]|nr:SDR family NAD(P)-dependent oxidoreductase [Mucilaginibacter sp.]